MRKNKLYMQCPRCGSRGEPKPNVLLSNWEMVNGEAVALEPPVTGPCPDDWHLPAMQQAVKVIRELPK